MSLENDFSLPQFNMWNCVTDYSVDETKIAILPELVELTNDEHSRVRLAGLDTVVSILSLLDRGLTPLTLTN